VPPSGADAGYPQAIRSNNTGNGRRAPAIPTMVGTDAALEGENPA
jgi:hypothetical protein